MIIRLIIVLVYFSMQFILFEIFENQSTLDDFEKSLVILLWPLSLPIIGVWTVVIEIMIIFDTITEKIKQKRDDKRRVQKRGFED